MYCVEFIYYPTNEPSCFCVSLQDSFLPETKLGINSKFKLLLITKMYTSVIIYFFTSHISVLKAVIVHRHTRARAHNKTFIFIEVKVNIIVSSRNPYVYNTRKHNRKIRVFIKKNVCFMHNCSSETMTVTLTLKSSNMSVTSCTFFVHPFYFPFSPLIIIKVIFSI